MTELQKCFATAGFGDVKTVLGSGNVVFTSRKAARASLERKIEEAMQKSLGRVFTTTVRSIEELAALRAADPYQAFTIPADAKRVVTLLRAEPTRKLKLPIESDNAQILCIQGTEVFSAYGPNPKGPVFMTLLEKTLGKDITTRTWDTLGKVVKAGT
jgi:uncharacterized protein (DUF1697 family)